MIRPPIWVRFPEYIMSICYCSFDYSVLQCSLFLDFTIFRILCFREKHERNLRPALHKVKGDLYIYNLQIVTFWMYIYVCVGGWVCICIVLYMKCNSLKSTIYRRIDYYLESAIYGFLFTSLCRKTNERGTNSEFTTQITSK